MVQSQRKWSGIPGPSAQTCLSSLDDFPHSFSRGLSLLWVASMAPVLLCDLPSGGCSSGPGTSVWHPDCGVRCWAEGGPVDNVAAQPGQEPLPLGCRTEAAQSSKLLVHWKWARGSCLVRIWAGWESFVQVWNPGGWYLAQSSRPALEA